MSLTIYIRWPLVRASTAIEVHGHEMLLEVKRRAVSTLGVASADFTMIHEGAPLRDLKVAVADTGLCEGDSVVIEPSQCLRARIQLMGTGLEGTVDDFTSLDSCSWGDVAQLAELLVDANSGVVSSVNAEGLTPLHLVAKNGSIDVARVLTERGADVAAKAANTGSTPLHAASKNGRVEVVQLLLDHGADAGECSVSGNTPLHLASHLDVVSMLLKHKAEVNTPNYAGSMPLHNAASMTCCDIAKVLLGKGADPNAMDQRGWTPLFYASLHGNTEMAEMLLRYGAQPIVMDTMGSTPLHVASHEGHWGVARVLVRHSACLLKAADKHGHLPIHHALMKGHHQTADLLVAHGADSLQYDATTSSFRRTRSGSVSSALQFLVATGASFMMAATSLVHLK